MPVAPLFKNRLHVYEELPFAEAHKLFEAPIGTYESPPVDVNQIDVPSAAGPVPILTYRPTGVSGDLPIVIWMHGGGFQFGSYTMNEGDVVARELAYRGKFVVVNVEYRLVNETVKFPAPQDDCMAILDWVVENANHLGGRKDAIFVGGVSAGGCLAASMAVLDRDNGNRFIAGQLLNCPVLHLTIPPLSEELSRKMTEVPPQLAFSNEMVSELNKFAIKSGNLEDAASAWWPGEVASQEGLPPAQIINCEYDTLRATGEKYGQQLVAAGVQTEVITQAGVPHAHLNRLPADCAEAVATVGDIIRFVDQISAQN